MSYISKSFRSNASLVLILAFLVGIISANIGDQQASKDQEDQARRLLPMPGSLSRFLFYSTRPAEHLANLLPGGYKRSSSALDALTGVTLGKRSASSDFINMEPYFGRQYSMRNMPRMYDLRWAPLDSYDSAAPVGSESR